MDVKLRSRAPQGGSMQVKHTTKGKMKGTVLKTIYVISHVSLDFLVNAFLYVLPCEMRRVM